MTREELRDYVEFLRSQDEISYDVYSGLIDGIDTLELESCEDAISCDCVLGKIRAEIEQEIEKENFARSVFRYEEKDAVKAEQCTGSIHAYHNAILFIDKYKSEIEVTE